MRARAEGCFCLNIVGEPILPSPVVEKNLGDYKSYTFLSYEEKSTPTLIMLSFTRISGSNYAYNVLNISFLTK